MFDKHKRQVGKYQIKRLRRYGQGSVYAKRQIGSEQVVFMIHNHSETFLLATQSALLSQSLPVINTSCHIP